MSIVGVGLTTGDFANRLQDLPSCLTRFKALGVDAVELSLPSFDVIAGARPLAPRVAELKRITADFDFRYTVHGPIASSFTDRRHLGLQIEVCKATLEVSGEVGATAQVHHAGWLPTDDIAERDALLAVERDALAAVAPHAEAAGVVLCVENIFSSAEHLFLSPAELAAQVRAVNHPSVRACIDFSHAAINASVRGYDLMAELAALAPVAGHLHVHDSFGRPQSFKPFTYGEGVQFGLGDLHLPPGWGALDWDALAALPYREPVIANLELSTRFDDALPEAVAVTRRMMRRAAEAA